MLHVIFYSNYTLLLIKLHFVIEYVEHLQEEIRPSIVASFARSCVQLRVIEADIRGL